MQAEEWPAEWRNHINWQCTGSSLFTIRQSIVARALPVFLAAASNIKDSVRRIRLGVLEAEATALAQKLISFPLAFFALVTDLFCLSLKLDFVSIWWLARHKHWQRPSTLKCWCTLPHFTWNCSGKCADLMLPIKEYCSGKVLTSSSRTVVALSAWGALFATLIFSLSSFAAAFSALLGQANYVMLNCALWSMGHY